MSRRALACLLLLASAAVAQPRTVFVVRHAEKAAEPAADPDLTPGGQERALALADLLAGAQISAVYSTATERTRQTAAPLARRQGLEIVTYDAKDPRALAAAVGRGAARNVLIVGHSNTVPGIVQALGAGAAPALDEAEFDNLYVVNLSAPGEASVVRLHYGPPAPTLGSGRSPAMQITFSRSGGFAALPGMTIEATLSVDAKGARVESDGGQYQRALSVAEMAHFALLAEPAGAARLAEGLRAGAPAGQADRFHFQLSFGSGARRHSFDFSEGHIEGLRAQAPALAAMLEWIAAEAEQIWQARRARR